MIKKLLNRKNVAALVFSRVLPGVLPKLLPVVVSFGLKKVAEARRERLWMGRDQQERLLGAISDAVLAVDTQGLPLFYNSRFALLFGDKNIQNRRIWKMFLDTEILNAFQSSLKEGKSCSTKAILFEQPLGRYYFTVSVSPLLNEKNKIYGCIGIFHDVTDLKSAEQIRIDFVANVSHELRTPLTAIKGYAETLIEDVRDGRAVAKEYVEAIGRNTDRLLHLINDLLDLSSLESTDTLHRVLVNTEEASLQVLKQIQDRLDFKGQKVKLEATARTVFADPRRLEQVLVNLLDNANKYTPSHGEISIFWEPADGNNVILRIEDTGPGIPPEHQSRLFERFYRVDRARSRELGGTGLGLAIVKHIMQRHGGAIWVKSKPSLGAAFFCQFPGEVVGSDAS